VVIKSAPTDVELPTAEPRPFEPEVDVPALLFVPLPDPALVALAVDDTREPATVPLLPPPLVVEPSDAVVDEVVLPNPVDVDVFDPLPNPVPEPDVELVVETSGKPILFTFPLASTTYT